MNKRLSNTQRVILEIMELFGAQKATTPRFGDGHQQRSLDLMERKGWVQRSYNITTRGQLRLAQEKS